MKSNLNKDNKELLEMFSLLESEFNEDEYLQDDAIIAADKAEELANIPFDDEDDEDDEKSTEDTQYIKQKDNTDNMSNEKFPTWNEFKKSQINETSDFMSADNIEVARNTFYVMAPLLVAGLAALFTSGFLATKDAKVQVLNLAGLRDANLIDDDMFTDLFKNYLLKGKSVKKEIDQIVNLLSDEEKVQYQEGVEKVKSNSERVLRLQNAV